MKSIVVYSQPWRYFQSKKYRTTKILCPQNRKQRKYFGNCWLVNNKYVPTHNYIKYTFLHHSFRNELFLETLEFTLTSDFSTLFEREQPIRSWQTFYSSGELLPRVNIDEWIVKGRDREVVRVKARWTYVSRCKVPSLVVSRNELVCVRSFQLTVVFSCKVVRESFVVILRSKTVNVGSKQLNWTGYLVNPAKV